ncbi:hypothetical protein ACFPT7_23890 [Acidicapsa dinghuensis]|uniref:Uncharacterized protein n=1 Tax=Acidicapsa dinghuensis TaxID=2218256 RepID=A0ABW1ENJ4_9BACT|nr:hypothetical protein [Acidicapsa dinghuensis]
MGFDGFYFGIPMLLVTLGTLVAGGIPVLFAWCRIVGQSRTVSERVLPKALCVLTASICVDPLGFCAFAFIPYDEKDSFAAFLVCSTAMTIGFLLSLAAPIISREQNVERYAVFLGSIALAVVNLLGLVWLFITKNNHSL